MCSVRREGLSYKPCRFESAAQRRAITVLPERRSGFSKRRLAEDDHEPVRVRRENGVDDEVLLERVAAPVAGSRTLGGVGRAGGRVRASVAVSDILLLAVARQGIGVPLAASMSDVINRCGWLKATTIP